MDALGDRLESKIVALGNRLESKIDAFAYRFDSRIEALALRSDTKLESLTVRLDGRIDTTGSDLRRELTALNNRISSVLYGLIVAILVPILLRVFFP